MFNLNSKTGVIAWSGILILLPAMFNGFGTVDYSQPQIQPQQIQQRQVQGQQPKDQLDLNTVRFVGEVLTGTEYGEMRDQIAVRWTQSPRLSTFGPSSHHPSIVKKVVDDINSCLPEQCQIEILAKNDESASLKVYFAPMKDLADLAKEKKLTYIAPNLGFFNVRWNGRFELVHADVLIAENKLKGDRLQHFLLEEITQSLGFGGDSPRFSESVFFENKRQRSYGTATKLSDLDRKLIQFNYNHVAPGAHPIELGILMTKHWKDD